MAIWQQWVNLITTILHSMSAEFGLSEAMAIIALTLLVRAALMPLSLAAALRQHRNKATMARLKPQLDALQQTHKAAPLEAARASIALTREHGVSWLGKWSLANIATQTVVGLGAFHSVSKMVAPSRFLWIASLAKPDAWLSLLVGVLMLLSMVLAPGAMEHGSLWIMLIPVVVATIALASFPSALGVYWATSNTMGFVQALVLRQLVARHASTAAMPR